MIENIAGCYNKKEAEIGSMWALANDFPQIVCWRSASIEGFGQVPTSTIKRPS